MMSEGNMNVSEHFQKHLRSTKYYISEAHRLIFILFFCHVFGQTLITFVANYYICGCYYIYGQLLHLRLQHNVCIYV